jgi:hypothetical protein
MAKLPLMITVDVLGKRRRMPFSGTPEQYAEIVAGQRTFAAEKRRQRRRAQRATGAEKVAAIREYMLSSAVMRASTPCCR